MPQRAIAVLTAISIGITFFDNLSCSSLSVGLDQTGQHLPPTCTNELWQPMTLVRHHSFFGSVFIDTDHCGQGIPPQELISSSHLAITIWSLPSSLQCHGCLGRRVECREIVPKCRHYERAFICSGDRKQTKAEHDKNYTKQRPKRGGSYKSNIKESET